MRQYLDVCKRIMRHGADRTDRTGTGTRALFAQEMRFDLRDGFPIVTTKKIFFRSSLAELLWFLAGDSDERNLRKLGCPFWEGNAYADYWLPKARFPGDAGRIYGVQWRSWLAFDGGVIDQLSDVIERIKSQPWDRRLLVSAWNPGELDQMCLPPCHDLFQLFVAQGRLSLLMHQRSGDMFLGVPYNISSYALLLSIIAQITELEPHELIIELGDAHVYRNHFGQMRTQMGRKPYRLPRLVLDPHPGYLQSFVNRYRWILRQVDLGDSPGPHLDNLARLDGYQHHPAIRAPLAV